MFLNPSEWMGGAADISLAPVPNRSALICVETASSDNLMRGTVIQGYIRSMPSIEALWRSSFNEGKEQFVNYEMYHNPYIACIMAHRASFALFVSHVK